MDNMLRLAIQSKGRLSDESTELLRDIGIGLDDSHRKFLLQAPNFPLELLYLRDDDIPQVVRALCGPYRPLLKGVTSRCRRVPTPPASFSKGPRP